MKPDQCISLPAEHPTVVLCSELGYKNARLEERIEALQKITNQICDVVDAHEIECLSCDRDGQIYCDCLRRAVVLARSYLPNSIYVNKTQ